jgi:hypothetical protein
MGRKLSAIVWCILLPSVSAAGGALHQCYLIWLPLCGLLKEGMCGWENEGFELLRWDVVGVGEAMGSDPV